MTNRKNNKIPFLDLVTPHVELQKELTEVFASVLRTGGFVGGPMVEAFEREFAEFCDARECVGVSSGTDALRFALMAIGIPEGSIVITVPNTFIATTEAITQAGGVPAFVDVDERTYNMDPDKLREYLAVECYVNPSGEVVHRKSKRTVSAIIPVHLYGQPADMDAILEVGSKYGLPVIEDACQAHGALYFSRKEQRWRKAGSMGVAAAFSFYPGKNLGACGEGGAVTTNDAKLAQKMRMLRDHGQAKKYYHDIEGFNGRLDALQAGLLRVKLGRLAEWNESRRQIAGEYRKAIAESGMEVGLPHEPSWAKAVYHLYVVRVRERAELQDHLAGAGIGTGIHYPVPLHLQKAYQRLGYKAGNFPVTERVAPEILSLPMYPGMEAAQLARVAAEMKAFLSRHSRGLSFAAGVSQ